MASIEYRYSADSLWEDLCSHLATKGVVVERPKSADRVLEFSGDAHRIPGQVTMRVDPVDCSQGRSIITVRVKLGRPVEMMFATTLLFSISICAISLLLVLKNPSVAMGIPAFTLVLPAVAVAFCGACIPISFLLHSRVSNAAALLDDFQNQARLRQSKPVLGTINSPNLLLHLVEVVVIVGIGMAFSIVIALVLLTFVLHGFGQSLVRKTYLSSWRHHYIQTQAAWNNALMGIVVLPLAVLTVYAISLGRLLGFSIQNSIPISVALYRHDMLDENLATGLLHSMETGTASLPESLPTTLTAFFLLLTLLAVASPLFLVAFQYALRKNKFARWNQAKSTLIEMPSDSPRSKWGACIFFLSTVPLRILALLISASILSFTVTGRAYPFAPIGYAFDFLFVYYDEHTSSGTAIPWAVLIVSTISSLFSISILVLYAAHFVKWVVRDLRKTTPESQWPGSLHDASKRLRGICRQENIACPRLVVFKSEQSEIYCRISWQRPFIAVDISERIASLLSSEELLALLLHETYHARRNIWHIASLHLFSALMLSPNRAPQILYDYHRHEMCADQFAVDHLDDVSSFGNALYTLRYDRCKGSPINDKHSDVSAAGCILTKWLLVYIREFTSTYHPGVAGAGYETPRRRIRHVLRYLQDKDTAS